MASTVSSWNRSVPLSTEHGSRELQRRSSAWDLQSDSEQAKQRRTSLRQNNSQATRKRSKNALRGGGKLQDAPLPPVDVDGSAWIHRDKLMAIEVQELREAGLYVRPSRRSMSEGPARDRTSSRSRARPTSRERQYQIDHDEDYSAAYPAQGSPHKPTSTVLSSDGDGGDGLDYYEDDDEAGRAPVLQRPDTYDPYRDSRFRPFDQPLEQQQPSHRQHSGRPSTSRIPVSRTSPAPVPLSVVDRDSPLPRSRAGSQTWNGSFDELRYIHKPRSGSVGSQVLLEQTNVTPPGTANNAPAQDENSPPKSRVPKKTGPNSRKASNGTVPVQQRPGSSHLKQQTLSSTNSKRSASAGHKSRPSYAPEGEAPFASQFKPDPMLPPELQILPTHAKRMFQEQWEKEGNTGTAYDRELRLLNNDEFQKPKPPVLSLEQGSAPRSANASPTKQLKTTPGSPVSNAWDAKSDSGSVRPPTSGGYRITPTIPSTPTMERFPNSGPLPAPPPANATSRIPDLEEKQEAAPKRSCCIIM